MFASRASSRPARTAVVAVAAVVVAAVVAVAVAAGYCRDDNSWKSVAGDRPADSVAGPATAGNRCRSVVGCSTAATAAAPRPAAADRTAAGLVAPAGAADGRPGPSPRASCPAPPASRATCTVRNLDHRICPDLAPPEPEKCTEQRGCYQKVEIDVLFSSFELVLSKKLSLILKLTRPTRLSALPMTSKFGFRSAGLPGILWDRRSAPTLPLLSVAQGTDERGEASEC